MDLNIGLAPLRPSLFNRSKSEIKFLEYAAAGAAVIASRHGPYERVIEQGVTGLLVNSPHEWTSALNQLATDPGMRMDLALNGLAYARTRMIEQHWQGWEKVYSGAW
jgi:glycosyltransferase involved in cell wall biosynthesis